jgi:hypothetical protein
MKLISMLIAILMVTGCTTLKPVELSPDQLQDRLPAGEIIQVGDSVEITTADGNQHKFKVTSITNGHVAGKDVEVPIADIVAVGKRETSMVKTLALVGGSVLAILLADAASNPLGGW